MPEIVPCNLCGSTAAVPEPRKTRFLGLIEPFAVCRCTSCGLIYLSPRPTPAELAALYGTEPYYSADNATRGASRRRFYGARMQRLEHWRPGRGALLGIGCLEGGYALEVAQSRGWDVLGVESVEALAAHARLELSIAIEPTSAWDLSRFAGRRFDAVYTHSFEHMPDARLTLRQCRALLGRDSVLMIEVPNQFHSLKDGLRDAIQSFGGARSTRLFYRAVSPHFHMFYFTPSTIRRLLTSEGFEVLELRTYLPSHPVYLMNPRARWLQEAIYAFGGLLGRGPTIEVIARPAG
jgi:hypothetical protein